MIQSSELRISNYVYSSDFVIKSYSPQGLFNLMKNIDDGYNNIKPIPLTEQWLIDFGFEKHITMDIYPTYSLNNVNVNDGVVYIVGFGFVNYIKHVHELQNLYFALTGIELIKQ
jgi:hypothetical protein